MSIEPMTRTLEDEPLIGSYRDIITHKLMLEDIVRTTAYEDAIRSVVMPGDRVIDFGAGTGVLSIFAARAGAGRVDAIERTSIVEHAREIARRSGHPEIVFHHADHRSVELDGRADVIVSEWMGHFVFFESMLEPLICLRDRWLAPDGVMIPARIRLWAALVIDEELYANDAFLEGNPYGIDFGPIADLPHRQSRCLDIEEWQILSPYVELGTLDMRTVARTPQQLAGSLVVERDATAYGFIGWFSAELSNGVGFSTGPDQPRTHWRPIYFPFPEPFDCSPERPVQLSVAPPRDVEASSPTWAWEISDSSNRLFVDESDTYARCAGAGASEARTSPTRGGVP
jgi:SAM-dependent methyltransferase